MANTKQAQKMVRKTERQTQFNRWWKSLIKNSVKQIATAGNSDQGIVSKFQKTVDKAVKNHVIHPNKANRLKSSLMKKLQSLN